MGAETLKPTWLLSADNQITRKQGFGLGRAPPTHVHVRDRRLMHQRAFDSSWTAFTAGGARWLVDHTDIRLIGIDYLSVATMADLTGPHDIILGAVRAPTAPYSIRCYSVILRPRDIVLRSVWCRF